MRNTFKLYEALLILMDQNSLDKWVVGRGGCTEHSMQYVLSARSGELCWTAGGTAGGALDVNSSRFKKYIHEDGYFIISRVTNIKLEYEDDYVDELVKAKKAIFNIP